MLDGRSARVCHVSPDGIPIHSKHHMYPLPFLRKEPLCPTTLGKVFINFCNQAIRHPRLLHMLNELRCRFGQTQISFPDTSLTIFVTPLK